MIRKLIVHPVLLAAYPVLALWAENQGTVGFAQVVRSLLIALLLSAVLWTLAWLAYRNIERAALLTSVVLVIFFSYGHIYNSMADAWPDFPRHRYLLPAAALLFAGSLVVAARLRRLNNFTLFFNSFSALLIVAPIFSLGSFAIRAAADRPPAAPGPFTTLPAQVDDRRPDIYYIIVDAYGREDVLQDLYHRDNSEFVQFLRNRGFYVADQSNSNYRLTYLSLASSLNMRFVQDFYPQYDTQSRDISPMYDRLVHSPVRQIMTGQGYKIVSVDNLLSDNLTDADVFLTRPANTPIESVGVGEGGFQLDLNEFEGLLMDASMLRVWTDWLTARGASAVLTRQVAIESEYNRFRAHVQFMFDSVDQITAIPGRKFVFIHFPVPHPPFVFGTGGEPLVHTRFFTHADGPNGNVGLYIQQYGDQVTYLDTRLEPLIDTILRNSATPPIIILQGDHGPRGFMGNTVEKTNLFEAFGILNAYYFPDGDYSRLYPSISPVNSFRVVLDQYFAAHYDLLADRQYWTNFTLLFNFVDVTDRLSPK